MKIKYDLSLMKFIALFERITGAKVKDCFQDDVLQRLTFVVQPGQIRKAIGKQGANIKKLEAKLKKRLRVVEFDPDKITFIQHMILPLKVKDIEEPEDGVIVLHDDDMKTKGLLIGRNAANLRNLEKNCQRYFKDVKEIKVV